MRRLARDVEALCGHDYGVGGGSMLCVGSALLSMPELRDTEETDLCQRVAQPSPVVIPPMFGSAMSIARRWLRHAYFRTPYIAGVKARTCFLSIGLVMASATFWLVLM